MPKPNSTFQTEQSSNKGKYTSFNLNALLPKQKPYAEASVKGLGNSRMQVLGKSSVLSRAAPKVPLPFNLPSLRKESAVEANSETECKDGKDYSSQKVEFSRQEQPNSYATVAASRVKSYSVRYSPTMGGKSALEAEEHFRDVQEGAISLQSSQVVETSRSDLNVDMQQKNFPSLTHGSKSPAKVAVLRSGAVDASQQQQNQVYSGYLNKSEGLRHNDSRGANERGSYSTEGETVSEPETGLEWGKPSKDKKRVILRRQEETKHVSEQDPQVWKVEKDKDAEYGVSFSESEPVYESDTVIYSKHEVDVQSLNSGSLSDSVLTPEKHIQQNGLALEDEASRVSEQDALRSKQSQVSKDHYTSSKPIISGRYRQVSPKVKERHHGRLSENVGRRVWRVVSDQRNKSLESERRDSVSEESFPKVETLDERNSEEFPPTSSQKWSKFADKAIPQTKDNADSRNVSEMNSLEKLVESISLQETSSKKRETDVDFTSSSVETKQKGLGCNDENVETEEKGNVSSVLTFGSLFSDLNMLNDPFDSNNLILDGQSPKGNTLKDVLWSSDKNEGKFNQQDNRLSGDKSSNTPISKQKLYHKFSRKRSSLNGTFHKKKPSLSQITASSKLRKNGKVWMIKHSVSSSFLSERSNLPVESSYPSDNEKAEHSTISNSQSLATNKADSHENEKVLEKWRKKDSSSVRFRTARSGNSHKEWVAKQSNNIAKSNVVQADKKKLSRRVKAGAFEKVSSSNNRKLEIHSRSISQKNPTAKAHGKGKPQEMPSLGRNAVRWRKVTDRKSVDETTKVTEQERQGTDGSNPRPRSSKTRERKRVQYVPKSV